MAATHTAFASGRTTKKMLPTGLIPQVFVRASLYLPSWLTNTVYADSVDSLAYLASFPDRCIKLACTLACTQDGNEASHVQCKLADAALRTEST